MQSLDEIRLHSTTANLAALQRIDSSITSILYLCKYVVLYKLDLSTQQWQKCNTEGVCFIVSHSNQSQHTLIILNRKSIDNYILSIKSSMKYELNQQYIFYMLNEHDIFNLCHYDINDAQNMYNLIQQIITNNSVDINRSNIQHNANNTQPTVLPVQQQHAESNIQPIQSSNTFNKSSKVHSLKQQHKPVTHSQINSILSNNYIDTANKSCERQLHARLDSFLKKFEQVDQIELPGHNQYDTNTTIQSNNHQNNVDVNTNSNKNHTDNNTTKPNVTGDISTLLSKMNIKHKINSSLPHTANTTGFQFNKFAQSIQPPPPQQQLTLTQFQQELLNLINDEQWVYNKYQQYITNNHNNIHSLFT